MILRSTKPCSQFNVLVFVSNFHPQLQPARDDEQYYKFYGILTTVYYTIVTLLLPTIVKSIVTLASNIYINKAHTLFT